MLKYLFIFNLIITASSRASEKTSISDNSTKTQQSSSSEQLSTEFSDLPPEMKEKVFDYLPFKTQLNVAQTNKENQQIIEAHPEREEKEIKYIMDPAIDHLTKDERISIDFSDDTIKLRQIDKKLIEISPADPKFSVVITPSNSTPKDLFNKIQQERIKLTYKDRITQNFKSTGLEEFETPQEKAPKAVKEAFNDHLESKGQLDRLKRLTEFKEKE